MEGEERMLLSRGFDKVFVSDHFRLFLAFFFIRVVFFVFCFLFSLFLRLSVFPKLPPIRDFPQREKERKRRFFVPLPVRRAHWIEAFFFVSLTGAARL